MKEQFREKRFTEDKIKMLGHIQSIIGSYARQHIALTLRQLYYQLVSANLIANTEKEYKKLGVFITDARYSGLVDWEAIEDRIRIPTIPSEFADILELVEAAKNSYRLPRWEGQEYYVELMIEKDALSSVLAPKARKWHIPFSVNRGYSSASAMYDTYKRILDAVENQKSIKVLYIGDHDPSGLDMVRDIRDRIEEFMLSQLSEEQIGDAIEVIHIALTTEQVRKYKPPPNPAKITDPRATKYISEFGRTSWEVDALKPEIVQALLEDAIKEYVDVAKMERIIDEEKKDLKQLEDFAKKLEKKKDKKKKS